MDRRLGREEISGGSEVTRIPTCVRERFIEESPVSDVDRSLIDIPSDVLLVDTIIKTTREERHLCGWVDPLEFFIGNTQRRNDTSERIEEKSDLSVQDVLYPMRITGDDVSTTRTRRRDEVP